MISKHRQVGWPRLLISWVQSAWRVAAGGESRRPKLSPGSSGVPPALRRHGPVVP